MVLPQELEKADFALELSEPHQRQLAALASLRECPAGTLLFKEDEDWPFIYCILRGCVSLQVREPYGEPIEIDQVGPGELLGWSPVFGRHAMTASAHAVTPCRLLAFDAKQVVDLCERDPQFALAFLRRVGLHVSARLRKTRRALALARTLSQNSPYAIRHEGSD
jgi:CRP-like cAMP-binding protein